MGILTAMASKNTLFRGEAVPFVMELPNYRMPGLKNTLRLMWDKARDFLERAFTVIFIGTIVVWFLQTFDFRLNMVADTGKSMLALIAGAIAPIFTPAGLGDWKLCTALISGFLAKESVVSTLSVLYGGISELASAITPLTACSLPPLHALRRGNRLCQARAGRHVGSEDGVLPVRHCLGGCGNREAYRPRAWILLIKEGMKNG